MPERTVEEQALLDAMVAGGYDREVVERLANLIILQARAVDHLPRDPDEPGIPLTGPHLRRPPDLSAPTASSGPARTPAD
jgi:hypothetical protein